MRWVLAACILIVALPSAAAHAQLLSSQPGNGARLDQSPSRIVVTLTEAIEPSATTMHATSVNGTIVDGGAVEIEGGDNPVLTLPLQPNLPKGAYRVVWKVFSKDTHTVTGSIAFAVGDATVRAEQQPEEGLDFGAAESRFVIYAGYALALGGALFLYLDDGHRRYGWFTLAGLVLHASGLMGLIVETSSASGLALGQFSQSGVGHNMVNRLSIGLAGLLVASFGYIRARRLPIAVGAGSLVVAAGFNAAVSHTVKLGALWMSADFLHLVAAATWTGGLLTLVVALRGRDYESIRRLGTRFGRVAMGCVAILLVTGTLVAIQLVTAESDWSWGGALASSWGLSLIGKVSLACSMLVLAATTRYVLLAKDQQARIQLLLARIAPALWKRRGEARTARRAIALEALLGALVLVLAGTLTSASPPAGEAPVASSSVEFRGEGTEYVITARLPDYPRAGDYNDLILKVTDREGNPVENNTCGRDSCVVGTITYENATEPDTHVGVPHGDGIWLLHSIVWTRPGQATLSVQVSTQEVYSDTVTLRVTVQPGL